MLKNNDREKYNDWWGRIRQDIYHSAKRKVQEEADDIVQDVGLLAVRNWSKFANVEYNDFARWCHIRTKFLVLDELRKRSVRGRDLPTVDPDTLHMQEKNKDKDIFDIRPLLERLPTKQKDVVFYMLRGHKTSEIASLMQIDARTVRSHWRHAQIKLANLWERES